MKLLFKYDATKICYCLNMFSNQSLTAVFQIFCDIFQPGVLRIHWNFIINLSIVSLRNAKILSVIKKEVYS